MACVFALSGFMLHPKTRVLFKSPVPHIHKTVAIVIMMIGITYALFLPVMYFKLNNFPWSDHAYMVVSLLSVDICMSMSPWFYLSYLQQGIKQRYIQPIVLFVPILLTLWYSVRPEQWISMAFFYTLIIETTILAAYYVILYRRFIHDIESNYSSVSRSMKQGLFTQWIAAVASFVVFLLDAAYDNLTWYFLNIFINIATTFVFIYSSEQLMPLPEEEEKEENEQQQMLDAKPCDQPDANKPDIATALHDNCEATLFFCTPKITLLDLAKAIGTNRTYLSKWFSDHDITFYKYINNLRIEYAEQLLRTTDYSISQIQEKAGFSNKTTFFKYFAEHYNCSPTEYKKSVK